MTESQNIEYKQTWRDDYLKWICGFANAQGGKIFIGMNDNGDIVGMEDYNKLMEDIPNKAVNHLGLVVDVNHHEKDNKHYIEIDVPVSSVPISYHGVYHYRTGSTKQELEVWNPGLLPEELTIEKLKSRHSSYPRNPHIAEVFFKAGYIEAWGRGTTDMINECITSGLPEPVLEEDQGGVRVIFLKDIYTLDYLGQLGLSDRQMKTVLYVKQKGFITNSQYQQTYQVSASTALRDLDELVRRNILVKEGDKKGSRYLLKK